MGEGEGGGDLGDYFTASGRARVGVIMDWNFKTFHFDPPHPSRSAELATKPSPARGEEVFGWKAA